MNKFLLKIVFSSFICLIFLSLYVFFNFDFGILFVVLLSLILASQIFRLDVLVILIIMLAASFFLPFHYLRSINIYNVVNPLTFLGSILCAKMAWKHSGLNVNTISGNKSIDVIYKFFILSAVISSFFAISVLGALNWIFYSIITGFVVYRAIVSLQFSSLSRLIRWLVFFAALAAAYGVFETVFLKHSLLFDLDFKQRLSATIGHPLTAGLLFSSVLPFAVGLYINTKNKVYLINAFLLAVATVLTFSRGSWLSILCGFCIAAVMLKQRLRLLMLFVLILVLSAAPFKSTILARLAERENRTLSSFDIRVKSIPVAFKIIKDRPLWGGGPYNSGRYKDAYATDMSIRKSSFENSYLGIMVDLGLIGLVLFLLMLLSVIMSSIAAIKKMAGSEQKTLSIFALSSLIILCVNLATFNFDSYRAFHFFLWLFIAINVGLLKSFKSHVQPD